jgi:ABC-type phosphate transport system substrate-binding protein
MSAFKQKMGRVGVRAGLLASASAAVLAVSAIGASSASALCVAGSTNVQGKGSSLQKVAQGVWTGREVPSGEPLGGLPHTATSGGYAAACPAGTPDATVSYTATSSGSGLAAFGFSGGALSTASGTLGFVGTDDAPNGTQIASAESAAKTADPKGEGTKPVIVPVAQTAIAVVVNLPAGCSIEGGINYKDLNKLFAGTITTWKGLETDNGNAACSSSITRVVREESSGTSYQFKNYLAVLQASQSGEGPGCSSTTNNKWSELLAIGTPNITWPECSTPSPRSPVVKKAGGGALASYVASNANTIGYVALPDAKAAGAKVASLQDEAGEVPGYGTPEEFVKGVATKVANCGKRVYDVPKPASEGAGTSKNVAVDWSSVFGAAPEVGSPVYPLCTLTYDIGWHSYGHAGYPAGVGAVVKDYLANYVLNATSGQAAVNGEYYAKLPKTTEATSDVLTAAQNAAVELGE